MNIKGYIDQFTESLSHLGWYDEREIRTMATYILKEVASIESYKIIVSPELELGDEISARLQQITAQMATGRPMQYALGYEYFCSHKFNVAEGVLIPRPETEELVRLVADDAASAAGNGPLKILDICTGSGCIAWSIAAALPGSKVWGCDISEESLKIAQSQNIDGVEPGAVNFFKCDVLAEDALSVISSAVISSAVISSPVASSAADLSADLAANLPENDKFDIIISNPPYVCDDEKKLMRPNVLDFEPHLALFVPDEDPLLFYRRIAELSAQLLKKGGMLYFETNERFAYTTAARMAGQGFKNCRVITDFFEKDRMARGQW